MKAKTKKELESIAKEAMKVNAFESVHVASNGMPFGDELDCQNYCNENKLKYESFGKVAEAVSEDVVVELESAKETIGSLTEDLEVKGTELDAANKTIEEMEVLEKEHEAKIDELEESLKNTIADLEASNEANEENAKSVDGLKDELKKSHDKSNGLEKEIGVLKKEIANLKKAKK